MSITRIGPTTTKTFDAIRNAFLERQKAGAISELTHLQVIDALVPISKGRTSNSLAAHIANMESQTNIFGLKDKLTETAEAAGKLKTKLPANLTEDSQSASQIRDQVQKFELIIAGNLEGVTVIPASVGMLEELALKDFLDLNAFGAHILGDPRKTPLFYTPQKEIDIDSLGLNDTQRNKLEDYLFKRDYLLSHNTIEINDSSRPFILDDIDYLKTSPEVVAGFRTNRGIKSPINSNTLEKTVSESNNSRIRFDTYPANRITDVSTYLTFNELQKLFISN